MDSTIIAMATWAVSARCRFDIAVLLKGWEFRPLCSPQNGEVRVLPLIVCSPAREIISMMRWGQVFQINWFKQQKWWFFLLIVRVNADLQPWYVPPQFKNTEKNKLICCEKLCQCLTNHPKKEYFDFFAHSYCTKTKDNLFVRFCAPHLFTHWFQPNVCTTNSIL